MAKKDQMGLGKGLSALLGELEEAENAENTANLPISRIEPNRDQPRRNFDEEALAALADSVAKHGIITPVVVRKIGEERYQLIAGERRYRAARMAGLQELPARVLEVSDSEAYEMALVENLQREDLDPIEEAEGFRVLMDTYGLTQEKAAERVGRSRPAVANALRLLTLPEAVREMVSEGQLSAGHARALLVIENEKNCVAAARIILEKSMSVRQAESFCKNFGIVKPKKQEPMVDYAKSLSDRLASALGRKVKVTCNRGRGTVVLHYDNYADLDAIVAILEKK